MENLPLLSGGFFNLILFYDLESYLKKITFYLYLPTYKVGHVSKYINSFNDFEFECLYIKFCKCLIIILWTRIARFILLYETFILISTTKSLLCHPSIASLTKLDIDSGDLLRLFSHLDF